MISDLYINVTCPFLASKTVEKFTRIRHFSNYINDIIFYNIVEKRLNCLKGLNGGSPKVTGTVTVLFDHSPNLMNLSRVSKPSKTGFNRVPAKILKN